jgi:hypothetical protein
MTRMDDLELSSDQQPDNGELNALFGAAWPDHIPRDFRPVFARSLAWVVARSKRRLVGYVNVAGDGGDHAFLLDPTLILSSSSEASEQRFSTGPPNWPD